MFLLANKGNIDIFIAYVTKMILLLRFSRKEKKLIQGLVG